MSHTAPKCEQCLLYEQIKCGCKERASPNYGGQISPFTPACGCFMSTHGVYSRKNKPKKWRKVRTLDDMCDPTARLI